VTRTILFGCAALCALTCLPGLAARRGIEIGARSGTRISANSTFFGKHTCAVNGDGTLRCWGSNQYGQLGDGTTTDRSSPVRVTNLSNVISVAAGATHTCALRANGIVSCWGNNANGELGDGTTTSRSTTADVPGLTGVVAIAAGQIHTCAVRYNGTVYCWGSSYDGQIGNGSTSLTVATPTLVVEGLSDVIGIAAGLVHTCALKSDGTVFCWGDNTSGQLGQGSRGGFSAAPTFAVSGLSNAVSIAGGHVHTCAVRADGAALCWGDNASGQLGRGNTTTPPSSAAAPVLNLTGAIAITGGSDHACALRSDGNVLCWGGNESGQIGDGTNAQRLVPTQVVGLNTATEITAGSNFTCALEPNDTPRCWGDNSVGQLGDGTRVAETIPSVVSGGSGSINARGIAAGYFETCARRDNGAGACWGRGPDGDGTLSFRVSPITLTEVTNASMVVASEHFCFQRSNGSTQCLGRNDFDQVGDGVNRDPEARAVAATLLPNAVSIAAGDLHTCAVLANGTATCWGYNSSGQVGDNTFVNRTAPTPVTGLTNLRGVIAAGGAHSCAVRGDGTVACWGANLDGELGDGTNTNRPTPVTVLGLSRVVSVAAGAGFTCALRSDGVVLCWGRNANGQLGDGTVSSRTTPVPVGSLTTATAITAGRDQTCAILSDSTARCWGLNASGQLGDSTTTSRLTPTAVVTPGTLTFSGRTVSVLLSVTDVVAVSAGFQHTCLLLANGQPECWGDNQVGAIGDGTTAQRLTPVVVPSFTANVDPQVSLVSQRRIADVTALVDCAAGQKARVLLTLQQGQSAGYGTAEMQCTGALEKLPMTVEARGPNGFQPGDATAVVEAVISDANSVLQDQHWTRSVVLTDAPPPGH
jgi:alpha-tubulin suppressor-like RCC1 family protein